tara:strand:+ start:2377 stop:3048 length:672 start_codon:yes stop_codon:yes gene_type:complete
MSIFLLNSYVYEVADTPVDQVANAQAMSFNGTDQYVNISKDLNSTFQGAFSYSVWVKFNSLNATYDSFLSAGFPFQCYILNGTVKMWLSNSNSASSEDIPASSVLTANSWHHIVFTRSGNGVGNTNKIYINKQLDITDSSDTTVTLSTSNLTIGSWENPSGVGNYYFNGQLDEVALFNTELSPEKITQIYDATAVVGGVPQTANLFTGGLDSSLVYWNRMGDS